MNHRLTRFALNAVIALLIAGVATFAIDALWRFIGGGDLPLHGWIALLIGTIGTIGLTWALMSLAFKSNREGWDDRVDNSLDPGRHEDDDRP